MLPNIKDLTQFLSLLVMGFVARSTYRNKMSLEKEEQFVAILWSLVWSALLSGAFIALHISVPAFVYNVLHLKRQTSGIYLSELLNIVLSYGLGFVWGIVHKAWLLTYRAWRRGEFELDPQFLTHFLNNLKPTNDKILHYNVSHEFVANYAFEQWVIVELYDSRFLLGWISRYDRDERRFADYHIILSEARRFNPIDGVREVEPFADNVLLKGVDIKSMYLPRSINNSQKDDSSTIAAKNAKLQKSHKDPLGSRSQKRK